MSAGIFEHYNALRNALQAANLKVRELEEELAKVRAALEDAKARLAALRSDEEAEQR